MSYKYSAIIACFIFLLLLPSVVFSQVSFEVPSQKFETLNAITNFAIKNASPQAVEGLNVRVELTEELSGKVMTIFINNVNIKPGVNFYNDFGRGSTLSFYNTKAGNYLKLNDKLADGNYRICYSSYSLKSPIADAEYCMTFRVSNLTPLLLITPINKEQVCDERPLFQWQNPVPLPSGAKVRFVLVALLQGQNETEAINRNIPLVNVADVAGNNLPLPSFVASLIENTSHAWQVTIYNEAGIIKKSEIWTFKKNCSVTSFKNTTITDAYRELKPRAEANYYLVQNIIRFSFVNSYSAEKLAYKIIDIATGKPIKYYPEIRVHPGVNKVDIDVDDCTGFKKQHQYLLEVYNVQNSLLQMKFFYAEK